MQPLVLGALPLSYTGIIFVEPALGIEPSQAPRRDPSSDGSGLGGQDIARLITDGTVDRKEGLANSDSPTNLMWRLQNDFSARAKVEEPDDDPDDEPSFTEITLDVKH